MRMCCTHRPGVSAWTRLHAFLLEVKTKEQERLKRDGCFVFTAISEIEMNNDFLIFYPFFVLAFMILFTDSLRHAAMRSYNFPTYIHINICIRQAPDYCTISIHITPRALMKQFCVLIPCDAECMTCCIR